MRTTNCWTGSSAVFATVALLAVRGFASGFDFREDGFGGLRIFARERFKGRAAFLFLIHRDEGLSQLEHTLRRARTGTVFLYPFGEGTCRIRIVLLDIGNIADPIEGLRREVVLGI